MELLNYTQNRLLFVTTTNLQPIRNNRFEVDNRDQLEVLLKLEPVGERALRAEVKVEQCGITAEGIPIQREVVISIDPLPEGTDLLIVSKQYADACRRMCWETERLRVVVGPVYVRGAGNHFPVACMAIAKAEACMLSDSYNSSSNNRDDEELVLLADSKVYQDWLSSIGQIVVVR